MTTRLAINGFGRIGRLVLRAWLENPHPDYNIVALNGISNPENALLLLRYDSIHGRLPMDITLEGDSFITPHGKIAVNNVRDLNHIDWRVHNIDIVLECSGQFNDKASSSLHITQGGAKKVFVSAPCKDADITVVYGVNHQDIKAEHHVISNASCTTNCLAPLAKILHSLVGIQKGYMTTIHAYTGDQNLIDTSHKCPRRARAAAMSMIPSSTGAAKALGLVIPELAGKLDGSAMRVPTANVSFLDLTFLADKMMSRDDINQHIKQISNAEMKNIIDYCDEPLVSIDFNHHPASCIFDASQTQITDNDLIRVGAWYDNEWGFSLRMLDNVQQIIKYL